ncbi:prepilin-type N-terminal cleavage/methylation domain-containing protein [Nitrincola sp. MINF-07-Sa-05]|uniref:prepilin-type N-terminal cleavage/methylation domain-containing protein n=1 Tax=Nitrincola salilacus TaxID=3400273 RepID=UPI0039180497
MPVLRLRQQGFSMVEMMLGLLLSMILLGGVISTLLASQQTYLHKQRLDRDQEVLRFAMTRLTASIRQAQLVGEESDSQLLLLHADGGNDVRNCLGQLQQPDGTAYSERFRSDAGGLRCNAQELIQGVANILFEYGSDLNGDGVLQEGEFFSTPDCCLPVLAVRILLVFESGAEHRFMVALRAVEG